MLFTVALGLASVWMWNGFQISRENVTVDLPMVQSDQILSVFAIEQRWMPIGGGSGPDGPHIGFYVESENEHAITFQLWNYLKKRPVFLFVRNDGSANSKTSVPYFLECLEPGTLRSVTTSESFEGKILRLSPRQHIEFDVPRPKSKGRCWVRVPIDNDPAEIERLDSFQPSDWKEFDRTATRYVSAPFYNK